MLFIIVVYSTSQFENGLSMTENYKVYLVFKFLLIYKSLISSYDKIHVWTWMFELQTFFQSVSRRRRPAVQGELAAGQSLLMTTSGTQHQAW